LIKLNEDYIQLNCSKRISWKNELGAKSATLIYATADISTPASSFGHTFLRLETQKNNYRSELLDYAINYAALTDDSNPALFALKGLFGHYPGFYSMLPYHQKIQEYSSIEARDLWEYKLSLSEDEVRLLVDHLIELSGSWQDYYFATDNCSSQILELIESVKPEIKLSLKTPWVIPSDTLNSVHSRNLIIESHWRGSLLKDLQSKYSRLGSEQKMLFASLSDLPPEDDLDQKNKENNFDAPLLESIMASENLKIFKGDVAAKEKLHRFSLARAKLGGSETYLEEKPANPLEAPNSQQLAITASTRSTNDIRLSYRLASHDDLDKPINHAAWTRLEVLFFEAQSTKNILKLNKFKLFDLESTENISALFGKPIWRIGLGMTEETGWFFLGYGAALDTKNKAHRIGGSFSVQSQQELNLYDKKLYPGFDFNIWSEWNHNLRSRINIKEFYDDKIFKSQFNIEIAQYLNKELQLRFKYSTQKSANGSSSIENQLVTLLSSF
jgi:hypothetical protein